MFCFCSGINTEWLLFDQPYRIPKSLEKNEKNLYFLTNKIAESLGGSGYSVERLSVPYVPQVTGKREKVINSYSIIDFSSFFSMISHCIVMKINSWYM
jgi:hypothetical protein